MTVLATPQPTISASETGTETVPLLEVENLSTEFATHAGTLRAVDGVSMSMTAGEVLGIVGESGSGKSVTALSILGLIRAPGRVSGGSIRFQNHGELLTKSASEMRKIRGDMISMIFQEPMTSLNPVFRVGWQIAEALRLHRNMSKAEATERAAELLERVGIASPRKRVSEFPHQLSGGMRQRVMIAMAMACAPKLLLADEPTTALDVTVQAQILDLMVQLKEEDGAAVMLITHDLGVIAEMAQKVAVMYAGVVMEEADVGELFDEPLHPYTQGLLNSIPRGHSRGSALKAIPGIVPNLLHLPTGCRFRDRCPAAHAPCGKAEPPLQRMPDSARKVRCWLHHPEPPK
ncbi:ABC transporter ATP-binding protein [Aliishimia ponticola]|uniref:ABC transporter ATP-binding protein n=1 Tax=Aliishimia ponticola TaxID=2499833 RepID=A0A4S4N9L7_9RHOB|nr:ABC transporter ATP-binding protein [Aliishimia ponticola]THH34778.1 ABC transporter ATP-binding protein [Aliishimia ponticola]